MSMEVEEDELPPLEQQAALWMVASKDCDEALIARGVLPLVQLPIGFRQEGDWKSDWAETGQTIQRWVDAGSDVVLQLEGDLHGRISGLMRSSVRQLLQLAGPGLQRAAAVILAMSAAEGVSEDGRWEESQIATWADWASVLPDGVLPLVAVDLRSVSREEALHLALSEQVANLLLVLRMPAEIHQMAGEVPWLGWGVCTPKGALLEAASVGQTPEQALSTQTPPAKVGIVFPNDRSRSAEDCGALLRAWQDCRARGWAVRLLREEEIHQAWHGLEALVVLGDRISGKGRRQLAGFFAAGGAILWLRQPTGMVEECLFEGCQEYPRVE